jgi:hypothetical protein
MLDEGSRIAAFSPHWLRCYEVIRDIARVRYSLDERNLLLLTECLTEII